MNREIEVGEKKYRISIGYGVYQRMEALTVFIRATSEPDVEQVIEMEPVQSEADMKKAAKLATTALKSEEIIDEDEAEQLQILGLSEGIDFFELLNAEQKLSEKIHEVKVRILEIAVRDAKTNNFLSNDYIEYDLSPTDGEELFTKVIETFELIKDEITDKERQKNS